MAAGGKHLVNAVDRCVDDSLAGLVAVHSGLQLLAGYRVVLRRDLDEVKHAGKVTLLSGGGSGHEPAHAGYVGPGMLTAAVCGAVFASPPPDSILAALIAIGQDNPGGSLMIVKNYTGDRLNFGLAAERAKSRGLKVQMVVVEEDCSLTSQDKTAGRRGLCGTVLIHKIAGALAENGRSLEEIADVCRKAVQQMGTMGLSLSPCSIPGVGPSFQLEPQEMELGLGIHGEAGVKRLQLQPATEAVCTMLDHMTNKESSTHLHLEKGKPVALMVNNLGGTSVLEMNIVAQEAILWLETRGFPVERAYCGSYMTSLEMAGVSLTVLRLDDLYRTALDKDTQAPGWIRPLLETTSSSRKTLSARPCPSLLRSSDARTSGGKCVDQAVASVVHKALAYAAEAVGNCEGQLNTLDRQSGDGDCGTTMKRGSDAILEALSAGPGLPTDCPHDLLLSVSKILETSMGGSSGALYSLLLAAAAQPLFCDTSPTAWGSALGAGIHSVMRYGGAEPGDRTMLDPLHAAHLALCHHLESGDPLSALGAMVTAAEEAAAATVHMAAHAGRASYVSSDRLTLPDPGAHAVGIWLRAMYEACKLLDSQRRVTTETTESPSRLHRDTPLSMEANG